MFKMTLLPLVAVLLLSACSSMSPNAEKLASDPGCKVWKDAALGTKNIVDVVGEQAVWKHSCGITGCSEVKGFYKGGNDIYTANSGLIKAETSIAQFDGKKFTVKSSMVKVAPFEIKDGKASYVLETMGSKHPMQINYNAKCTPRQVAAAIAILLTK